uniref:uncharacterized protein LOC100179328 isoform X2 n=1 Tax=Ciona intestinalis TaxID=7719 RepID=UPI0000520FD8|nr:uncharacterized protein LOC100179328 isoform X2 [Ciona intestinalis]XP_026692440.1 uncharacterized protein LOC100179328 isoform X2 [Ciona intestinalis]|eukprot:XP_009860269.1 uncharacterized protein LOC100179328 isoform X2 [Ciona intestinalis]
MGSGSFCLFLLLLSSACQMIRCDEDVYEDNYYAQYYGTSGAYAEVGELPSTPDTDEPANTAFEVRAECWPDHVTVAFPRNHLSSELEFFLPKARIGSQRCVQLRQTRTTVSYSVALSCPQVVTTTTTGSSRFYRHEALLIRSSNPFSSSDPYSVVYTVQLECEHFGEVGPEGLTFPNTSILRSEKRIFEHRVAIDSPDACRQTSCSYGNLCLPDTDVDGFFCVCGGTSKDCLRDCPVDYYACERNITSISSLPKLKCIKNGWLCDNRYDCDLRDDETSCAEIWSDWSLWTKCSSSCGTGHRSRRRRCDIAFTKDPDRCSRRCTKNKQVEKQQESCAGDACSSVKCDRRHMTIAIPREPEMTSQMIESRMILGRDPDCRPSYNDTHVIFVASLQECNMTSQVEDTYVLYKNEIVFNAMASTSSIIMRDMGHSYQVKCRFKRRRTVVLKNSDTLNSNSLETEVAGLTFDHSNESWAAMSAVTQHFASGDGEFDFKLNIYQDSTFSQPYQRSEYPLRKKLREELYLAVSFHTEDEDLRVVIDSCQGTPTRLNDDDTNAYLFIENGCPVDPTVRFLAKKGSRMDAFAMETFKFIDESHPLVYFQCNVIVCDEHSDDDLCNRNCSKGSITSRHRRSTDNMVRGHVVQGPIIVEDEETDAFEMDGEFNEGEIVHRKLLQPNHDKTPISPDEVQVVTSQGAGKEMTYVIISGVTSLLVGIIVGIVLNRRRSRRPVSV